VSFDFDAEETQIEIQHSGKGFSVPQDWLSTVRGGHYGPAGMLERAGAGTTVRVVVPYPPVLGATARRTRSINGFELRPFGLSAEGGVGVVFSLKSVLDIPFLQNNNTGVYRYHEFVCISLGSGLVGDHDSIASRKVPARQIVRNAAGCL